MGIAMKSGPVIAAAHSDGPTGTVQRMISVAPHQGSELNSLDAESAVGVSKMTPAIVTSQQRPRARARLLERTAGPVFSARDTRPPKPAGFVAAD